MASQTATIAESGTVSSIVELGANNLGAMYLDAEFNTDVITFQGSNERSGTFAQIHDSAGSAVTFTAAAGARWYQLPAAVMAFNFIKVVTGAAVAAAAEIPFSLKRP